MLVYIEMNYISLIKKDIFFTSERCTYTKSFLVQAIIKKVATLKKLYFCSIGKDWNGGNVWNEEYERSTIFSERDFKSEKGLAGACLGRI